MVFVLVVVGCGVREDFVHASWCHRILHPSSLLPKMKIVIWESGRTRRTGPGGNGLLSRPKSVNIVSIRKNSV